MKFKINALIKLLIASLIVLNSCHYSNEIEVHSSTIESLPIEDTLEATVIYSIDNTSIFNPRRIVNVNDEYLVIIDTRPEGIFQVFSLPSMDFLYEWGRIGGGPAELDDTPVDVNVNDRELITYHHSLRHLRFHLITDTTMVMTRELPLYYGDQIAPLNHIRRINDSLFVADYDMTDLARETTDHEYIALAPGNEEALFTFSQYPATELEGRVRFADFSKINTARPDGSKFAAFYSYHNMLKIYNSNGDMLKFIEVLDQNLPEDAWRENREHRFIYRDTGWSSDKYMYVLGVNATGEFIGENFETFKTSLEIWNWEGQPVYRSIFDRPIHGFIVSEVHRKLYAYSLLKTDEIYEYDLPDILEF